MSRAVLDLVPEVWTVVLHKPQLPDQLRLLGVSRALRRLAIEAVVDELDTNGRLGPDPSHWMLIWRDRILRVVLTKQPGTLTVAFQRLLRTEAGDFCDFYGLCDQTPSSVVPIDGTKWQTCGGCLRLCRVAKFPIADANLCSGACIKKVTAKFERKTRKTRRVRSDSSDESSK